MASPDSTTVPPGADNPQEKRTCAYCKTEKVVTPESWPYRKSKGPNGIYQAHGARCMACEKIRKAKYEATRDDITRRLGLHVPTAKADKESDKQPSKAKEKLDVTAALKAGSVAINMVAPTVMAKIITYLEDEESPHHEWALEFFAQRIAPRKLFEELGGQAAGVGALADKRPQFVLNILPATPSQPAGEVYENGEGAGRLAIPAVPEATPDAA